MWSSFRGQYVNGTKCFNAALTDIPPGLDTSLTLLVLSYKNISAIQNNKFFGLRLRELNRIDLSNNRLHTIEEGAFWGLDKLRELRLQNNKLSVIHPATFKEAFSLTRLDVGENSIRQFHVETLKNNKKLEYFNIGDNNLESISPDTYVKTS
jgi:Leucine-rich repeat (LRR) protein